MILSLICLVNCKFNNNVSLFDTSLCAYIITIIIVIVLLYLYCLLVDCKLL